MTRFLVSLAAVATVLTAVPATAGERTATISTAGLDLSQASDMAKFNRRAAAATEQVCGSYQGAAVHEQDRIAACRKAVIQQIASVRAKGQLARR
jgi:UrcA family protein